MLVLKHTKFASIRKLSGFFMILTVVLIMLLVIAGLSGFFGVITFPSGTQALLPFLLQFKDSPEAALVALSKGVTIELKILLLVLGITYLSLITLILININLLLNCFYDGQIFNRKAIFHAREAFKFNLIMVVLTVCLELFPTWFKVMFTGEVSITFLAGEFLFLLVKNAMWIAVLLLVIWPLEIGVALNEEVELTI